MPDPGLGRHRRGPTKVGLTLGSERIKPIVGAQFAIGGPRAAIFGPQLTLGWASAFTVVRSISRAQLAVVIPLQLESIELQPEPVRSPSTLDYTTGSIERDTPEPLESLAVK